MIYRLIAPDWVIKTKKISKVIEGSFSLSQLEAYNAQGYNVYACPNQPDEYTPGSTVDGSHITKFDWVFVDWDSKQALFETKDTFIDSIAEANIAPTRLVDSGNGIHVYWKVETLTAMDYLRFQRRLMRKFDTDPAVGQIFQLMRVPGTNNTKLENEPVPCYVLAEQDVKYTAEELDRLLPPITLEDEAYCRQHHDRTYGIGQVLEVDDKLPSKFGSLLKNSKEASQIWAADTDDRSKNDFRLGHIMFANDFSKAEAMSVLVNSAKALQRAPTHRVSYAQNIVEKIWTAEEEGRPLKIYSSVKDILSKAIGSLSGDRIPCHKWIDNTECGFRRGHVMGLIAGSGVGKTTVALNIFQGFAKFNPELHHFFVPLEQVDKEIAQRWQTMCGENTNLHDKVHIISNYDDQGTFRDLSLAQIKENILSFISDTGNSVGCVVIDHIGVLCNTNKLGQDEGVKQIAKDMKGFAVETNTFLIMQSQTSREKQGSGDLELDKGSAFGTSVFENFCDWLVTVWQPLKRSHDQESCPTVTAFKFAKIRHKKARKDVIKEDVRYLMFYDSDTELLREMTQDELESFKYWNTICVKMRQADRKTELVSYQTVGVMNVDNNRRLSRH